MLGVRRNGDVFRGASPANPYKQTATRYVTRFVLAFQESGEPGRTRTYNPLLKRQLLYH